MVEPGRQPGFVQEVADVGRVLGGEFGQQDFQCDLPVQRDLAGEIDHSVVAAPEFADDMEPGYGLALRIVRLLYHIFSGGAVSPSL